MGIRLSFRSAIILAALLPTGFLWFTDFALGVPGEWTWNRHDYGADGHWHLIVEGVLAAAVGAAMLTFAFRVSNRIEQFTRRGVGLACVTLVALSWLWVAMLQRCTPPAQAAAKSTWILYDPGASGYFAEARSIRADLRGFLADYEERTQQGDVLHAGTHPPGLYLLHAVLLNSCEASPTLADAVLLTMPQSKIDSYREIERHAALAQPLARFELAALWLGSLFTELAVVSTMLPLFWLVRRWSSRQSAWNAMTWWPLIPAIAVFLPKSDAIYPVIGVTFLLLCDRSFTASSVAARVCHGLFAGVVLLCGLCLSLAMLPVALAGAAMFVWNVIAAERLPTATNLHVNPGDDAIADVPIRDDSTDDARSAAAISCVSIVAGAVVSIGIIWAAWGLNLPRVWQLNLENHSGFYDQFTRTYWKWLLVNPIELILAAGLPCIVAVVARVRRDGQLRDVATASSIDSNLLRARIGFAAVWALLWLSGKNSGETARLWIIFMPWLVISLGRFRPDRADNANWRFALVAQAIVCLLTVSRVSGFHFL